MGAEKAIEYEQVVYDVPRAHVARITMNRAEARNAQGLQMTYDLNAAFDAAAGDVGTFEVCSDTEELRVAVTWFDPVGGATGGLHTVWREPGRVQIRARRER